MINNNNNNNNNKDDCDDNLLESLSTDIFETRTASYKLRVLFPNRLVIGFFIAVNLKCLNKGFQLIGSKRAKSGCIFLSVAVAKTSLS